MMGTRKHISKVYPLLEAIISSKAKYIEVLKGDEPVFKIKLYVDAEDMVEFLDSLFDRGFTVREITKDNFDTFEGTETFKFNL